MQVEWWQTSHDWTLTNNIELNDNWYWVGWRDDDDTWLNEKKL